MNREFGIDKSIKIVNQKINQKILTYLMGFNCEYKWDGIEIVKLN